MQKEEGIINLGQFLGSQWMGSKTQVEGLVLARKRDRGRRGGIGWRCIPIS